MDARSASRALGWFSIGLGLAELLAGRRIARSLDAEKGTGLVRAFGAREIGSGLAILDAPEQPGRIGARVAGDLLDLAALAVAARAAPRNRLVWGSIAFVAGATIIDALVTYRLQQGRAPSAAGATSIEPAHVSRATAPAVA